MADVDHPKTHVEDQDIDLPRKQPESPHREGIDPLTESDTMYPAENVQANAARFNKKEEKAAAEAAENPDESTADTTVADQEERNANANTPDSLLPKTDAGNDNAEVTADKTDTETGTENTSTSNKTAPKSGAADSKTSSR